MKFAILVESHDLFSTELEKTLFIEKTFPLYDLYGHILGQEPLFRGSRNLQFDVFISYSCNIYQIWSTLVQGSSEKNVKGGRQ